MAVIATPQDSRVGITFVTGTDPSTGATIKRTRSYGPIKSTATDQDVYDFAMALIALQEYTVDTIVRDDYKELVGA